MWLQYSTLKLKERLNFLWLNIAGVSFVSHSIKNFGFCSFLFFCFFSLSKETGLDPEKMKLICKGHVIEDGMYQPGEVAIVERLN